MFLNRSEGLALALPAALFTFLVFLVPVGILLSIAFRTEAGDWSFQGYFDFFAQPLNQTVFSARSSSEFLLPVPPR